MRSELRVTLTGLVLLFSAVAATVATAQETGASEARPVVVLDTEGVWRAHQTLNPPVIEMADGMKPVLVNQKWLNWETPAPPADWTKVELDDSAWLRGPARIACRTAYLARLCLRGRFTVTDPAKVGDLRLAVGYHGGEGLVPNTGRPAMPPTATPPGA